MIWTSFSCLSSRDQNVALEGLLYQSCFPQLSILSNKLKELNRIDFIAFLPQEIAFQILSYLDAISLCCAAQVSKRWKLLADNDVVWKMICIQHINKKCTECGWGLPPLENRRGNVYFFASFHFLFT